MTTADSTDEASKEDDQLLKPQEPPSESLDTLPGFNEPCRDLRQTAVRSATEDVPPSYRTVSALIFGPPGAGKRELARSVAGELGGHGYSYDYVETLEHGPGGPADSMAELLNVAREHQPMVLVLDCLDEIHGYSPVRTFYKQLDEIRRSGDKVIVVGILRDKNVPHGFFQDIFRHFDVTVNLDKPGIDRRRAILQEAFAEAEDLTEEDIGTDNLDFHRLAIETDAFGVNDLWKLARRFVLAAADESVAVRTDEAVQLAAAVDEGRFERVMADARLRDIETPDVTFDEIGGLDEPKRTLRNRVRQITDWAETFEAWDVQTSCGILLHGPPGTGKTMLVRALANEVDYSFIPVKGPELKNPMIGGTEQNIRNVFERAQRNAPSIVFFDEFDSLAGQRGDSSLSDDIVNTLLTEMDGLEGLDEVVVIAATNRPDCLDDALMRPGRFTYHIEVPAPDAATQQDIFAVQTADLPLTDDITPAWFSSLTVDLTGADIAAVCDRAVAVAIRQADTEDVQELDLSRSHFEIGYEEFKEGRVDTETLSSPTFQ